MLVHDIFVKDCSLCFALLAIFSGQIDGGPVLVYLHLHLKNLRFSKPMLACQDDSGLYIPNLLYINFQIVSRAFAAVSTWEQLCGSFTGGYFLLERLCNQPCPVLEEKKKSHIYIHSGNIK